MSREFGKHTSDELKEARELATKFIEIYGDFGDQATWNHFRKNGIWNDHTAVQSALHVIMDRNDKATGALELVQALTADRADLIEELASCQRMLHVLAADGGCSPDYPNGAREVLQQVTGGLPPFFEDRGVNGRSLARRDAKLLREYADKLVADESPDAEAGDMWDACQCADWMREQADKAEGSQ